MKIGEGNLSFLMDITTEVENRLGTPGGHGNIFKENSNFGWS